MRQSLLLAAFAWTVSYSAHAATPANFNLGTTADLVQVCTGQTEAEIGFCQGFGVGVYRVIEEIGAARPAVRFVCLPPNAPDRTTIIGQFVTWAQAHPDQLTRRPEESVAAYLGLQFPCPAKG